VRRFQVRSADAFLRWILSQGREASIEAPEELAHHLKELRARVAALYQGGAAGTGGETGAGGATGTGGGTGDAGAQEDAP
jgi:hypothetical protein